MDESVTVAIPVYNEGKYIKETLESVIANYQYIDSIIISDNCSKDNTGEICKEFQDKYDKIQYFRQKKTISAVDNSLFLFEKSKTKYYMLIGGHDWISENYVEEALTSMRRTKDAVVFLPMIYHFAFQKTFRSISVDSRKSLLASEDIRARIGDVLYNPTLCYLVDQLWERKKFGEIVSHLRKHKDYINSDHIFAMYAAVRGKAASSSRAAYYYRKQHYERLGREESRDESLARYADDYMITTRRDNGSNCIVKEFINICKQYASTVWDKSLEMEIMQACHLTFNIDVDDNDWILRNQPKKIVEYLHATGRPLLVFGTGKESTELSGKLMGDIEISGYIENDFRKWGGFFNQIEIISPEEIRNRGHAFIIVATSKCYKEICSQLCDMGFEYGEDFIYWREVTYWAQQIGV